VRITVRLYASLREGHQAEEEMEAPQGSTIASVIEMLGIPETAATLTFVNGRHASTDTVLREGDNLGLFPPIGGG
jgi:sulfur-carrier protein